MTLTMWRCTWDFNPRSREGSDSTALDSSTCQVNFNPRSREGSDPIMDKLYDAMSQFQSTLP